MAQSFQWFVGFKRLGLGVGFSGFLLDTALHFCYHETLISIKNDHA